MSTVTLADLHLRYVAINGLNPLETSHRVLFDEFLSAQDSRNADYTFTNMFYWFDSCPIYWKVILDYLCVFFFEDGHCKLLHAPLPGKNSDINNFHSSLLTCFNICLQFNNKGVIYIERVCEPSKERIQTCKFPDYLIEEENLGGGDFIYDTKHLIELKGKSFSSKRHMINQFIHQYPNYRFETFDLSHVSQCKQLLSLWLKDHLEKFSGDLGSYLQNDCMYCERILDDFEKLGLKGLSLFVDDRLVGFTLGELLTSDQFSILIEKTDPNYHGAAAIIFSNFCKICWAEIPECNAGDDGDSPTLNFTKEHYNPTKRLNRWLLKFSAI